MAEVSLASSLLWPKIPNRSVTSASVRPSSRDLRGSVASLAWFPCSFVAMLLTVGGSRHPRGQSVRDLPCPCRTASRIRGIRRDGRGKVKGKKSATQIWLEEAATATAQTYEILCLELDGRHIDKSMLTACGIVVCVLCARNAVEPMEVSE